MKPDQLLENNRAWARGVVAAFCDGFNACLATRRTPRLLRALGLPVEPMTPAEELLLYRFYCYFGLTSQEQLREMAIGELMAAGADARSLELLLGEDEHDRSVISQKARELLRRYDFKVEHYEVKEIMRP